MKKSRMRASLKAKARRLTAGLICMCTMISMVNLAAPVSAEGVSAEAKNGMHILFRHWHAADNPNGAADADVDSDTANSTLIDVYLYHTSTEEDGKYKVEYAEGSDIHEDNSGDVVTLSPTDGTLTIRIAPYTDNGKALEVFEGFSVSAGHTAAKINDDDTLTITYADDVHLVKAHAFYRNAGVQVAGVPEDSVPGVEFGATSEQDTALVYAYPEGNTYTSGGIKAGDPIKDNQEHYLLATGESAKTNKETAVSKIAIAAPGAANTEPATIKVYNTEYGLHTDKTASLLDPTDRTYNLNLESWFVGNNLADVGLVLDASGSMAFTSENESTDGSTGVSKIQMTGEQFTAAGGTKYQQLDVSNITDGNTQELTANDFLSQEDLDRILNPKKTDNSPLGYSGYSYYIFDPRSTTNEYVPLAYWDGNGQQTESLKTITSFPYKDNDKILAGYYDMQKQVDSTKDPVRTWGKNHASSSDDEYAHMIERQDAGTISFTYPTDDNNKLNAVHNEINFDPDHGMNVSYSAKKETNAQAMLIPNKLSADQPFTVSFSMTSYEAKIENADHNDPSDTSTINPDEIMYIGPLTTTTNNYFRLYRGGGSEYHNHIFAMNGTEQTDYIYNGERNFNNYVKNKTKNDEGLKIARYTFVFDPNKDGTVNVKTYVNGTAKNAGGTDISLGGGSDDIYIILNGLNDNYNGQPIFVDNLYVFNGAAFSKDDVSALYAFQEKCEGTGDDNQHKTPWQYHSGTDTSAGQIQSSTNYIKWAKDSDSAALAELPKNLSTTDENNKGWYYVNSNSDWSVRVTGFQTGKSLKPLQKEIAKNSNVFYAYSGPSTAHGQTSADFYGKDGKSNPTQEKYYTYINKDNMEPFKFFFDKDGYLCCFYSSGSGDADRNGWSYVYEKKDDSRIKVETLQHALGKFAVGLDEASPGSRISAVRFSTESIPVSEYSKLIIADWSTDPENIISMMSLENGDGTLGGSDTTSEGGKQQYNYFLTGGTTTGSGLQAFADNLTDDPIKGANKYIVLFTDGKDTEISNMLEDEPDMTLDEAIKSSNAYEYATKLREAGYTIIPVMLAGGSIDGSDGSPTKTDYDQAVQFLATIAGIDTTEVKVGHQSSEITGIFEQIVGDIADNLDDYTVQDYIDPRFDLVDAYGAQWKLGAGGKVTVVSKDGTKEEKNLTDVDEPIQLSKAETGRAKLKWDGLKGLYYLVWEKQSITGCSRGAERLSVWNTSVTIRAKDDFIGGNAVLTNGNGKNENYVYPSADLDTTAKKNSDAGDNQYKESSSGTDDTQRYPVIGGDKIENYPSKGFPRTTVNVTVPDVTITSAEQIIYMGNPLTMAGAVKNLGESITDQLYKDAMDNEGSWYWEYLDRYAKNNNKNLTDIISDIVAAASDNENTDHSITYDYKYLPDDPTTPTNQAGDAKHQGDVLGKLTFKWEKVIGTDDDATEHDLTYSDYPAGGGETKDTDPRRSKLTVSYQPLPINADADGEDRMDYYDGDKSVVDDTDYKWDPSYKKAAGDENTEMTKKTGSYTTQIVSGQIVVQLNIPEYVKKYLEKYHLGQTINYTADLMRTVDETSTKVGTFTAPYTVGTSDSPVTGTIEYAAGYEYFKENGLPFGDYTLVNGASTEVPELTFGNVAILPLTDDNSSLFDSYNAGTTKKAADMYLNKEDPGTTSTSFTDFAAPFDDKTIKLGTANGEGKALDSRYGLAQVEPGIATKDLTITKTVSGTPTAGTNDTFTFTVTLSNAIDGTYTTKNGKTPSDSITVTDGTGTATFTLKHNGSFTISGLPLGTGYTITETPYENFTASVDGNVLEDGVTSGTISAESESSVAYTNTYAPPTPSPTVKPTEEPSPSPTVKPTEEPSPSPTVKPTEEPSPSPTVKPTEEPSPSPTVKPTEEPSPSPTVKPTEEPSPSPTVKPTEEPSPSPSATPGAHNPPQPTASPSAQPTASPSAQPTTSPSAQPTASPSAKPTVSPSAKPTASPSAQPTNNPTRPTGNPIQPTASPSAQPTVSPSAKPTASPSAQPTNNPTRPTGNPVQPTASPTATPTAAPTTTAAPAPSNTPAPTKDPVGHNPSNPTASPTPTQTAKPGSTVGPTASPTAAPHSTPNATASPTRKPSSGGGGGFKPASTRSPLATSSPSATNSPTGSTQSPATATSAPDRVTPKPTSPAATAAPSTPVPTAAPPTSVPTAAPTAPPIVLIPTQPPSIFVPADSMAESYNPPDNTWIPPRWQEGPPENETPKTGDSNMPALWITLSILFAAGALISIYKLTKKHD